MATIVIRNLDENVMRRLRLQARLHPRFHRGSML